MVRFVEADDNATFLEDLLDEEKDEEDNRRVLQRKVPGFSTEGIACRKTL